MMTRWKDFLDSIATRGGSIMLLAGLGILFTAARIKFPTVVSADVAAGFTGALLLALKGGDQKSDPPPQPKPPDQQRSNY